MSGAFEGQSVLVVGGTAGMGRAIAQGALDQGARVTVAGRRGASEIAGVAAMEVDIASEASIRALFARTGPIDHLVVTAAFVRPGPFRDGTDGAAAARTTFEGKFWSQYLCAKHAEVRRSITLFSGAFSRRPSRGFSSLTAVNAAIEGLGRALAIELAPVRVNVVSPGLIQGTEAYKGMPQEQVDGMMAAATKRLPAGLVGDAASVAGPTLAIMASPYVTGTVLDIEGGGLIG